MDRLDLYSVGDRVLLCDPDEGQIEGEVVEQREGRLLVYYLLPRLKERVIRWLPRTRVALKPTG